MEIIARYFLDSQSAANDNLHYVFPSKQAQDNQLQFDFFLNVLSAKILKDPYW